MDIKHNEIKIIFEILFSLIDIFKVHETLKILKIEDADESILMSLLALDEGVNEEGSEGYEIEKSLIKNSSNLWEKPIKQLFKTYPKFQNFLENSMVFSKIIA